MGSARETTAGLEPRIKAGVGYGDFSKFWPKNPIPGASEQRIYKGRRVGEGEGAEGEEEKYLGKTDDQAYFYSILFF